MKKLLTAIGIVALLGTASIAFADSNYWHLTWNDGDNTLQTMDLDVSNGTDYEFLVKNPTTHQAELWKTDTSIVWDTPTKQWEIGNISPDNVDLLTPHLNLIWGHIGTSTTAINSLSSTVSTHTSQIAALGTPFNMLAQATSSTWLASSTANALMSRFDKIKLDTYASTTGVAYEGTTLRRNAFPIFLSSTVGSGVAVVYLTNDGTSGGTMLCPNGVITDSVNAFVSDATASYQMAYAFSNSNKTLTVTTNKLTTANILTGILGQASGNGSVVKVSVWCY